MTGRQSAFENVTITLQHDIDEQYQFQPGEIIRGKIGIHLHRSTLVQSVYLSINGEGVCSWEDEYLGSMQSSENYIKATQVIFDSSDKPVNLEIGFHDFPFEYRLPENIPSSFIGKYGSITYILKAVVQGERTGDTTIATEPFLLMRTSVLSEETQQPVEKQQSKTCTAMCSWGKVKAHTKLNKTGFTPGEDIYIQAEVQNKSPLRVTAIQGALIMSSSYHAQKNIISYKQIVNKRRDDYELVDGDGRRWQNVRVSIPPYIPESDLQFCDIIELSYMFQFRVELSGGKEIKLEFPITIGANPKGLEIPADYDENVNLQWTMGPRDLAKQQMEDKRDQEDAWKIEAPEFRKENAQVQNPLFRNDTQNSKNAVPHKHRSNKLSQEFDDIPLDRPDKMDDTKL